MGRKLSKIYTLNRHLFFILIIGLIGILLVGKAEENGIDEVRSSSLLPPNVIDGDSLEIGNHRIRLMGIDAPEYTQYCKNEKKKNYPCGKKATEYLRQLVNNTQISCKIIKKDQYERDLCTCYANGKDLNREMILSGHAIVYLESPYHLEQKEAKQYKRGLWQGRFMHPRLFRRLKEQEKAN